VAKRRRGHGEGSVYQRRDGYWVASVEAGRYPNGKRRRARIVRRTKNAVLAELDDLQRRGAASRVGRDPAVGEFVDWPVACSSAPQGLRELTHCPVSTSGRTTGPTSSRPF
jgi:hypothetical protein